MRNGQSRINAIASDLPRNWGWFMAIGIVLMVLGILALVHQFIATVFSVYYIATLLVIAGVTQLVHSYRAKGWGNSLFWLIIGVLYAVTGVLAFHEPLAFSTALTLLIVILLIVSGITQATAALSNRDFPAWGWLLAAGVISFILGVVVMSGWPGNSLWILGMFLGIDLLFQGWAFVTISLGLRAQR